ncbi:MAG TPA: formyltransferase family protein, partial [Steroidobacteraceae bacterium]
MAPARLRLVALISGRGSNLAAIARACRAGVINAEVAAVIADRADAGGLGLAAAAGIATCTVPYRQYRERAAFEQALREAIDAYSPQL